MVWSDDYQCIKWLFQAALKNITICVWREKEELAAVCGAPKLIKGITSCNDGSLMPWLGCDIGKQKRKMLLFVFVIYFNNF